MERNTKPEWASVLEDGVSREIRQVHVLMMDDIEVEIGEDVYGSYYVRTRGVPEYITCVGLEHALAKEIMRLKRIVDEEGRRAS